MRKSKKDARDVSVNFRVSKYERALIDSLAQRLNKSVSDLMRDLLTENNVLPDRRWNLQELLNE